ncbi:hypothetical protein BDV98DRAFT_569063 [Pterulicium gracile]|uniref:Uncharacterized protein n=1 Tax=Pterulicium gracile TaxID=1884261 RepID=A0A5C3QEH7_9AGAR|nr:hypothetical protein BDV98DRAFT_569063 [Pterula gracilis]
MWIVDILERFQCGRMIIHIIEWMIRSHKADRRCFHQAKHVRPRSAEAPAEHSLTPQANR